MDGEHKQTEGALRHLAAAHKCSLILSPRTYMRGSYYKIRHVTRMPCCTKCALWHVAQGMLHRERLLTKHHHALTLCFWVRIL